MAKGGTLANIGQALAGYGSALSGNPMYLQNSLLLRQAQQQQAEQEAAKQREQMQGQAVRSMLMNTPLEGTGTPQAKAFQVNGRTVGQNIAAGPQLTGTNARGLMMQQALGPAFDNVFMGQKAKDIISQIFPQGPKTQVLKAGETLGTMDAAGNFTPTYTAPKDAPPLDSQIQVALWATGGDVAKARQMILESRRPKPPEAPAGYRWLGTPGQSDLAPITGGPADKPLRVEPPSGYRYGPDGTTLQPIPGGPADIGQKGLPQAYKEAKAGIKTLRGSVQNFRNKFLGTPEQIDPATGQKIPAVAGTGTEIGGKDAGTLDNLHTQILLGTKSAEALGALDKGAIDVAERMVRNPTGWLSPFQLNSYTESQIDGYLKYLDDKEKNLDEAYQAGTWRPPGMSPQQVPAGVSPQEWAAMTPEERALFR